MNQYLSYGDMSDGGIFHTNRNESVIFFASFLFRNINETAEQLLASRIRAGLKEIRIQHLVKCRKFY